LLHYIVFKIKDKSKKIKVGIKIKELIDWRQATGAGRQEEYR